MSARSGARWIYNAGLSMIEPLLRPRSDPAVLFLVGSGRSGTTALMEAVVAGLGAQPIFEPLRPTASRRVDRVVPAHGYPRIVPGAKDPEMEVLMGELFEGRHLTRWSTAQASLREMRRTPILLVKEVRANRMVGWVEQTFPSVHIHYTVRHPLAVVSSMVKGAWGKVPWSEIVPPAAAAIGVPAAELASERSPRSRWLTALWIADNLLAVRELSPEVLRSTIFYEHLRLDPHSALEPYVHAYPQFDLEGAVASLSLPSRMASPDFGRSQVVDRIPLPERLDMAAMLREHGIDFYEMDEPLPTRHLVQ